MVYKIMESNHKIFLETLVVTLLILSVGFFIGFYIEYNRTNNVVNQYKQLEIDALDMKLQNYYYQTMDQTSCDKAIAENFIFADKIYNTGLIIEKYEKSDQITDDLILEKKRYVLLKTELWLNSILLKNKCNNPFHTLVYFYQSYENTVKEAEQDAISNTLEEIKNKKGNKIILLPIAGDLDLDSVSMQLRIYNITYLPSILIDEKYALNSYNSAEEIEKYLN